MNVLYAVHADKIAAEMIDGEVIIINVETGTYYNTEGIGGWAWEQGAAGKSLDEMTALGARRYDADANTLERDLREFFGSLAAEELLSATEVAAGNGPLDESAPDLHLPYTAPKLVVYRDLKDLLALDPPMPRLNGAGAGAAPSTKGR